MSCWKRNLWGASVETKRTKLHDYQQRGLELLVGCPADHGAGLLLDPGLGKTLIALSAFSAIQEGLGKHIRMLVIVPINPMYGTWPNEIAKWEHTKHLTYATVHGTVKQRIAALNAGADITLINPEGLKWLFQLYKGQLPKWDILCVDESTKFKNSQSLRFKMLKKHLQDFHVRWIMTGTICPNGLLDLFAQVYVMDTGRALGTSVHRFKQSYFYQAGYGGYTWLPRVGAVDAIMERLESHTLQLKAEDCLNMPDFITVQRDVTLPPKAKKLYDRMEEDFIIEVEGGDVLAPNSAALGTKLRQMSNGAFYDNERMVHHLHDEKLAALDDIVEETNGLPLLIMYEFQHDRDRILKHLKDAVCLTGMKGKDLDNAIESFNEGKIKYLVMHPGTTHGMNVQKTCRHIVWFSIIWDLEFYIQANTRLYRQGQEAPSVMCYQLCSKGTVDKDIARALEKKDGDQKSIEDALRRYCSARSAEEDVLLRDRTG